MKKHMDEIDSSVARIPQEENPPLVCRFVKADRKLTKATNSMKAGRRVRPAFTIHHNAKYVEKIFQIIT